MIFFLIFFFLLILHAAVENVFVWVEAGFSSTVTHLGCNKQFVTEHEEKVGQPTSEYLGITPEGFVLHRFQQLK